MQFLVSVCNKKKRKKRAVKSFDYVEFADVIKKYMARNSFVQLRIRMMNELLDSVNGCGDFNKL